MLKYIETLMTYLPDNLSKDQSSPHNNSRWPRKKSAFGLLELIPTPLVTP